MRRCVLLLALAVTLSAAAAESTGGWVDLFNGKDLDGWVTNGKNWRVAHQDGEPVIECFRGGPSLTYGKPFGDAVWDLWFRLPPGNNSGLFFRGSKLVPGGYPPPATSYEVQLYDHKEMWGHRTGDLLYAHRARRWASKPGEWNHITMISVGYRHKAYLNGQCIYDVIDRVPPLEGYVCLQAHGGVTFFKRVRIKPITDGRWPEHTGKLKALLFVGDRRGIGRRVDLHGALIEKALDDTGRFEITWTPEEIALDPQYLGYYDLLILYDTRTNLPTERREQIDKFLRDGGGLVGLNHALTAIGKGTGTWAGVADIAVQAADPAHPVAAGVEPFRVRDDLCRGMRLAQDVHTVLATADDRRDPIGWASASGKGKSFALVLGQERATLESPDFQRILINACTWVCQPEMPERVKQLAKASDVAGLARLFHRSVAREDWPLVEALAQIGTPEAAAELAKRAAWVGDLVVRTIAVGKLAQFREAGLEELHKLLLEGKEPVLRVAAADALAARADARSVAALTKALGDRSELVKEKALAALGGIAAPEAEAVVLAKLQGDDGWWHEGALAALGKADSPRARAALIDIAKARAAKYRAVLPAVASALAAQMAHAEVFDAMVALLDAPERHARIAAAQALAAAKDPRVHDLFLPRVFGRDPDVGRIAEGYVRAAGKIDLARHLSPFVREWRIIGPFDNTRNAAARTQYPPEKQLTLDASYDGAGGKVRWQPVKAKGNVVNLAKLFPKRNQNVAAYAWVVVTSPAERDVQLRTGSDDGIVAWLGGKQVLRVLRPRGCTPDDDRTTIHLRRGKNTLLLKILQGGGDWGFCLRFADPKGDLAGLVPHLPK